MQLYEKHRPLTLDAVAGHATQLRGLQLVTTRPGWDRDSIWLQGPSGTGKTTIANILASRVCEDDFDIEHIKGVDCDVERVRDIQHMFSLAARSQSGWRACIVDEAHAMTPRAVQAWLTALEPLPRRRLVLFTSTEPLAVDLFGNFTGPLSSRCKIVELKACPTEFAEHIKRIAEAEGLGGKPLEAYRTLVAACKCNLRAALQRIESGDMYALDEPPVVTGDNLNDRVEQMLRQLAVAGVEA